MARIVYRPHAGYDLLHLCNMLGDQSEQVVQPEVRKHSNDRPAIICDVDTEKPSTV